MEAFREWWLGSSSGPELLMIVRVAVGAFMLVGFFFAAWNVWRPVEWERTWGAGQYTRVRIMNIWRAVALLCECAYLLTAGVLEADRTSSPHRLLVANGALFLLMSWQAADLIFWRFHGWRKRVLLARRGITPERDREAT